MCAVIANTLDYNLKNQQGYKKACTVYRIIPYNCKIDTANTNKQNKPRK